jgi:hypothetical protein
MKQSKMKRRKTTTERMTTTVLIIESNADLLCQRLAQAIGEVLITSKNDSFRGECFKMLSVCSSTEATEKILILATRLKGTQEPRKKTGRQQQQARNENQ